MNHEDKHKHVDIPEEEPVVVSTPEPVIVAAATKPNNNVLIIAAAIIIAGALIAAAIFFRGGSTKSGTLGPSSDNLAPVTKADHIRGNLSAEVKIVEFSDTECPFCKQFHPVLKQVFDEYGPSNKVAWVYRHFPLGSLHPKAHYEAEATECAGAQGPEKFWAYLDRIFEVTPANNGLDPKELPKIAAYVGLDVDKFNVCLASGKFVSVVDEHIKDGENSGVTGTPSSFLISKDGTIYPLQGSVSYAQLKQAVETLLAK